ncbi:MAG: hypothetical protein GWP14_05930 [Actinobacteria bacterium]|nr:hypothetical protein [Actinomycetota bacterium]
MSKKLMPFWRFLETRSSRTAVMGEWQTIAGDLLSVIRPLLQPIDRTATAYPNPRPVGRSMKVVRHGDGTIVAIDEHDHQNRLDLNPKDVVLYQLDLRKLRTTLCGSLSCVNIAKTPVDQATHCLQIGNWEPKKAASFPVYLLLCHHRGLLKKDILSLIARSQRPGAILLTPTRMNWDSKLRELARPPKMLLVCLSEVIEGVDGGFSGAPAWEEYLKSFCQMVKLELPSSYRNKKPVPMRGTRSANIEKLEKALERHIKSSRDYAHTAKQQGRVPKLLPRPTRTVLGKQVGLSPSQVSRCMNDPRARLLKLLWHTADSLEDVMKYKRRR